MDEKLLKIGITQGDTNGVGSEIILKTFSDPRIYELCIPVVYGSPKFASFYNDLLTATDVTPVEIHVIHDAQKALHGKLNLIRCVDDSVPPDPGKSTEASGKAAYTSLETATTDLKKGVIQALLTAPINKFNTQNSDFNFPGHTEYLEKIFGDNHHHSSLMVLLNDFLRVALVTGHIPLSEVNRHITTASVLDKLTLFNKSLREDFGVIRPRIAVLSLNPHAGDHGLIGNEDTEIIVPAIEEADKNGLSVFGPYPADGFFGARNFQLFDGILAMYHDQGLAPFKALAMDNGVNFTAGLPVIRTSPAHGTAYDIAGKMKASENSFRPAIYTIIDVYRNRKKFQTATANPLRKQYVDKSGDKEKLDLTKEE
jgi:4-hydroxythreonine-4-phosphate dehydrogenase